MRLHENSARLSAIKLILALAPFAGFGCGGASAPAPTSENGRKSVEVALEAWKAGKPAGAIDGSNPAVSVIDHDWGDKQVLSAFEILREETSSDEKKTKFVVKLTLGQPSSTTKEGLLRRHRQRPKLGSSAKKTMRIDQYGRREKGKQALTGRDEESLLVCS